MTAKKEVRCGTGATRGGRGAHRHGLVLKAEHRIIQATDTENQRPESTKKSFHCLSSNLTMRGLWQKKKKSYILPCILNKHKNAQHFSYKHSFEFIRDVNAVGKAITFYKNQMQKSIFRMWDSTRSS